MLRKETTRSGERYAGPFPGEASGDGHVPWSLPSAWGVFLTEAVVGENPILH